MDDKDLERLIISHRRALHRVPELDVDLPETRAYLLEALAPLGCEIRDLGEAGFTAFFDCGGGAGAGATAFRTDMDALPILESGLTDEGTPSLAAREGFLSGHEGMMHACGHDGHMAILLGLAQWVSENRAALPKGVLLIFQAAEETTGGAKQICASGVFEDYGVGRVFGLHLWPDHPAGAVVCREKEFMAGVHVAEAEITGRAAHIAEYWMGADALAAACQFVKEAYRLEASLPEGDSRILRYGALEAGTASNVVADKAVLYGTMRAFSDAVFERLFEGLDGIAEGIGNDFGVDVKLRYSEGYPPVINPPGLYQEAKARLTQAGFAWVELAEPLMVAEDFSYYQKEAPGLFLHLGTGLDCKMHTPAYEIDESVLMAGVRLFRNLLG
ncbi:MAG: amidohydrolase [Clostridiales Family XIII bacterium]|jgi:hippurate hydrolase|nr:amidohydrolase [Clostridiales Family XIII bacterium]